MDISEFLTTVGVSLIGTVLTAFIYLGSYKNKVDTLESTVGKDEHGGLRRTVGEIKDKVIACETTLKEREPLGKSASPISLTDRGEKILIESKGKEYVENKAEKLIQFIKDETPKSAYDVQQLSMDVMKKQSDEDDFIPLKNYLFKEGLNLEDIIFVTGIYLRDLALQALGFKTEDIDKHDPSQPTKEKQNE